MKKQVIIYVNSGLYIWERFVYIDYIKNEYDVLLKNIVIIIEILLNVIKVIKIDRLLIILYF